jgi:hypothetical protein
VSTIDALVDAGDAVDGMGGVLLLPPAVLKGDLLTRLLRRRCEYELLVRLATADL